MRPPEPDHRVSGFILTDALVALFILAGVSGALVTAFGLSSRQAAQADRQATALLIAKRCIEDVAFRAGVEPIFIDEREFTQRRSIDDLSRDQAGAALLQRLRCDVSWEIGFGEPHSLRLERIDVRKKIDG